MIRLSCGTGPFDRDPLRNVLPRIRAAGFEHVEMSLAGLDRQLAGARDRPAALRVLLQENGLALSGLVLPPIEAREAANLCEEVSILRERMRFAAAVGAPGVIVSAGDRRSTALEPLTQVLVAAVREAEKLRLNLLLGNANDSRVEQLDDLHYVLLEVEHPGFHLQLDAGEFHSAAVDPRHPIAAFIDRTAQVRIADRIGRREVALGVGETNVPAVMASLQRHRFDGDLVLVPCLSPRTDSGSVLRESHRYLMALLDNA